MTAEEELIHLRQQNSLLLEQVKQIPVLQEIITQLSEQVKQLQEQRAKDSHNSSLPLLLTALRGKANPEVCALAVGRSQEGNRVTLGRHCR